MSLTSRPREATSVATSIRVCPSLKSSRACSRSHCSLYKNHKKKCHQRDFNENIQNNLQDVLCEILSISPWILVHVYTRFLLLIIYQCPWPLHALCPDLDFLWPICLHVHYFGFYLPWKICDLESLLPICLVPNFVKICSGFGWAKF